MELPGTTLDAIPNLPGCRRRSLSTQLAIDPSLKCRERVLDMGALAESGAEEDGVEGKQDPAAALEKDGGTEEAGPQSDLKAGDNRHRHVVVFLDEGADGVGNPVVLGLGLGAIGGGDLGGRDDGGDDGGAGVGREVEDGVDGVGEQGQEVRGREEPDKGHDCEGNTKSVWRSYNGFGTGWGQEDTYAGIERSRHPGATRRLGG